MNKNILIHPNRIENRDETNRRLEKNRREPKPTGYVTDAILRNTQRHRDLLLPLSFIRTKMPSCACIIFQVLGKEEMMLQPGPTKYMNRTSICHATRRIFASIRRNGYRVELDAVPEPCTILHTLGIDPRTTGYHFRMEEWQIMDDAEGLTCAYKLIPLHPY